MNKKIATTSGLITILLFTIILSFSIMSTVGQPTNVTFQVNLTLSGNSNPTITWVQSGISANPVESGTRTVYVAFNASDNNGHADIDYSTAQIILSKVGELERASSICDNFNNDSLVKQFNCTITLQYYDSDGNWQINASVLDTASAYDDDTAQTFSYGVLYAARGNNDGITFGSVTLGATEAADNDPLLLDNTGNQNFTEINLTAYNLEGQGAQPDQYIDASNLFVNATADAKGQALSNNTPITIPAATLPRDIGGSDNNVSLYIYVDIPAAGLSNQDYVSGSPWTIQVFS